jgi:hypothetical protein
MRVKDYDSSAMDDASDEVNYSKYRKKALKRKEMETTEDRA